jgi:hypothetical protein
LAKVLPTLVEGAILNMPQARNDLSSAVPKFCYGLEVHRRTPDGRVRTAQEFLAHFFPHDSKSTTDRIFHYMPNDVRAPILTTWGVRGKKSALRDDDAKVQSVVHDALVAGDLDSGMFEDALAPDTIMRWVDLADWWVFWRGGKITKYTILRALESGYELGLFDAEWFLDTLRSHQGKLRGTDVLSEGLTKADLTEWVRRIHESGDGSPKGLLAALGWDQIVAKTTDEVLIAVVDVMAVKVSLAGAPEGPVPDKDKDVAKGDPKADVDATSGAAKVDAKGDAKADTKGDAKAGASVATVVKAEPKFEGWSMVPSPEAKPESKAPGGKADEKGVVLPGIPIPPTGAAPLDKAKADDKAKNGESPERPKGGGEESIDSESAANLFKDDELIPISSGAWDDNSSHDDPTIVGKRPITRNPPRGSK